MLFTEELLAALECILFVADEPLTVERIAQVLELNIEDAQELLDKLAGQYREQQRGIQLIELAGGYQITTRPDLAEYIERLYKPQFQGLSHAALETLAIIAYKQPVTRGEIELIRGVQADRAVATLLDKNLVKEVGRKEGPGRPVLFATTDQFLIHFGLKGLDDLPAPEDFVYQQDSEQDNEQVNEQDNEQVNEQNSEPDNTPG